MHAGTDGGEATLTQRLWQRRDLTQCRDGLTTITLNRIYDPAPGTVARHEYFGKGNKTRAVLRSVLNQPADFIDRGIHVERYRRGLHCRSLES